MPIIDDPSIPNPAPPTEAVSQDGILTATVYDFGVMLVAQFPESPVVDYVNFVRLPDIGVRSGTPAVAVGGEAVALDREAPLGVMSSWVATPVYQDGTVGNPSSSVSVELVGFDPNSELSCWVTSIGSPELSKPLVGIEPLPEFSREGRVELNSVSGSIYKVGSWDLSQAATTQLNFVTKNLDEQEAIEALFTSGPVLIQFDPILNLRSFYALPGTLTYTAVLVQTSTVFRWSVELTEQARPDPYGAGLSIPGRNYEDFEDLTYAQQAATFPTYRDMRIPQ